jgi:fucokinase
LTPVQRQWLAEQKDHRIRLQYYLGKALGRNGEPHLRESFLEIRNATVFSIDTPSQLHMVKNCVTHRLPLRVNFGGGWSDTPPYCQDKGGAVLNAAITLDGCCPVEVTVERLPQRLIRLQSEDTGALGEFDRLETLRVTGDPADPFALPKAALAACGILPQDGTSLKDHLEAMGGGFLLRSQVRNVPKGSGLGTSSILSAGTARMTSSGRFALGNRTLAPNDR